LSIKGEVVFFSWKRPDLLLQQLSQKVWCVCTNKGEGSWGSTDNFRTGGRRVIFSIFRGRLLLTHLMFNVAFSRVINRSNILLFDMYTLHLLNSSFNQEEITWQDSVVTIFYGDRPRININSWSHLIILNLKQYYTRVQNAAFERLIMRLHFIYASLKENARETQVILFSYKETNGRFL